MWIIPQHHTQIKRFFDVIRLLKNSRVNSLREIRTDLISELRKNKQYNGRQTKDIQSAGNHNIDEPFFYGLIYKLKKEVFNIFIQPNQELLQTCSLLDYFLRC